MTMVVLLMTMIIVMGYNITTIGILDTINMPHTFGINNVGCITISAVMSTTSTVHHTALHLALPRCCVSHGLVCV